MDRVAESAEELVSLEADVKHEGYVRRHNADWERLAELEDAAIPVAFPYGLVPGLSPECADRLTSGPTRDTGTGLQSPWRHRRCGLSVGPALGVWLRK